MTHELSEANIYARHSHSKQLLRIFTH